MSEEFVEMKKRPDMVSVLGILSFINCGLFILIYLLGLMGVSGLSSMPQEDLDAALSDAFSQFGDSLTQEQMDQAYQAVDIMKESGVMFMLLLLIITIVRLIGVSKMWKNRKQGFTLYAGAQLARVIVPVLLLGASLGFSWFGTGMAALITVLYGTQTKHMI